MNTTAKIQHKGQVTMPTSVRRQAGLSKGDLVNFAFQRGKIVITPRLVLEGFGIFESPRFKMSASTRVFLSPMSKAPPAKAADRSEERRVGKESRSQWKTY